MKSIALGLLTLVALIVPMFALADDMPGDKNAAAVVWVGDNDNKALVEAPDLYREIFTAGPQSVFNVREDRFFLVRPENPFLIKEETDEDSPSFERALDQALRSLLAMKDPVLYLTLKSHGGSTYFFHSEHPSRTHDDLAGVIMNKIKSFEARTKKKITLNLFMDQCGAGSMIENLKMNDAENYRVNLFASSNEHGVAFGNDFAFTILLISEMNRLNSTEGKNSCDRPWFSLQDREIFTHISGRNYSQMVYSSYQPAPKTGPSLPLTGDSAPSPEEIDQLTTQILAQAILPTVRQTVARPMIDFLAALPRPNSIEKTPQFLDSLILKALRSSHPIHLEFALRKLEYISMHSDPSVKQRLAQLAQHGPNYAIKSAAMRYLLLNY